MVELVLFFLLLLFISFFVGLFIFWVLMLIDVTKRKFAQENENILWVIIIIFAGIIGALIYYFVGRKKGKRGS